MTHIETPEANVAETKALLAQAGIAIPILPMEAGETYCRNFSFWQLVNVHPLVLR